MLLTKSTISSSTGTPGALGSRVGPAVPVRVPAALPVPAVVLGLADAHVGEDGLGAARAVFEGAYLGGGELALVGAVAGVVHDHEVELRLPDGFEVDPLQLVDEVVWLSLGRPRAPETQGEREDQDRQPRDSLVHLCDRLSLA